MDPSRGPVAGAIVVTLLTVLAGCSEEDRRAWVSILPLPQGERSDTLAATIPGGELALAADSSAVLVGADTLFSLDRLPRRAGGSPLAPARFGLLAFSPDSSLIGFTTAGGNEAVGVWSRPRQVASVADVFPGGGVDAIDWSPGSRFLAYQGRTTGGITRTGIYDAGIGLTLRHPVVSFLEREGRSVRVHGWVEAGRQRSQSQLRVLVSPGVPPEGGLAHVWEAAAGSFAMESHVEPLAAEAPPGAALGGNGVFSLDMTGDTAPETVALYRSARGAPGAIMLESRGTELRARASEPLVPPEALGLEGWGETRDGASLYLVTALGGRPTLLLQLPSGDPGVQAIGFFQAREGGPLAPVQVVTPEGERPAIFFDGRTTDGTTQLGLVDLDEDGGFEVISAMGQPQGGMPTPSVAWRATVFRWSGGRLVPAPDLEGAALARVARAASEAKP